MTATDPIVATPIVATPVADTAAEPPVLAIADVAAQTGVTAHTLRYYERIGLVTVPRDAAGRRRYGPEEVGRVVFITRLRMTAMPIRDIQAYFRLVTPGTATSLSASPSSIGNWPWSWTGSSSCSRPWWRSTTRSPSTATPPPPAARSTPP